jgi:hypothetical protein
MKTRALGFLLMVAAAGVYAVGCGSSNNNGTGGAGGHSDAGTGGKGTGGSAGAGMGGMGTGGKMDAGTGGMGTGGKTDAGPDTATDMATDMAADTQTAPTFTQVFAILSNVTTPSADTAPGCVHCHDGIIPDGGQNRLPHNMNLADKAAAYAALVGVDSVRCAGSDAGGDASAALKRVLANSAAQSVLYQKLNQGVNPTQLACDNVAMPLNLLVPADGGGTDAGDGGSADAGFVQSTHYAITSAQLATVMGWINAGALNN